MRSRGIGMVLAVALLAAGSPALATESGTITVGSKNFEESRLLAEVFARLVEARTDLEVKRTFNLAGTQICFEALQGGSIDLYPEYTGTGLVTLLGHPSVGNATEALGIVRREFLAQWDLWWLGPLGFENAYEIAVPRTLAERENLRTLGDLARIAGDLHAGLGYEFIEREDGLKGLSGFYGFTLGKVSGMQQQLKYQAAGEGRIDLLDVYTTDGLIVVHDLVVLADDREFFPPYEAAPLVRGETLARYPQLGSVLGLLTGALDEDAMRAYNKRLQLDGEPVESVAQDLLEDLGLVGHVEVEGVRAKGLSLPAYMAANRSQLLSQTLTHLGLTGVALLLGVLIAVPLGLVLERRRAAAETTIRIMGVTQTIPSIALLAFMIPLFGVGVVPAVMALWIYSIFPILRNTYTGVRDAGPAASSAGLALGMTEHQVLQRIRLPLAAPVILAGIRTAAVITVGTATLAAFIGAGGLGEPIVSGLQMNDATLILSGAIPAALLALLVDAVLGWLERRLTPKGMETTT